MLTRSLLVTSERTAVMSVSMSETERPAITSGCFRCGVTDADVARGGVLVSPTGKAHQPGDYGQTACGIYATGDKWWWPL